MPPAVRLSDKAMCPADAHGCPACPHPTFGPLINGSPDVMINKLPAIRLGDPGVHAACCGANSYKTAKGSSTVYVNGKPLVRMGDKTTHCGGSGTVVNGSPNVFADDGGLAAAKASGAKAKDGQKGEAKDGKYEGKKKDKNGNWIDKNTKNKDKSKKGKDANGKDEDLAKDEDEAGADKGAVQSIKFLNEIAKLGEKIGFLVECGSAVVGTIEVVVSALGAGDKKSELAKTSVEAKLAAEGSVQIKKIDYKKLEKEIGLEGDTVKLGIVAKFEGKETEGTNVCLIASKGTIVFSLYEEKGGEGSEPTNSSDSNAIKVTKKVRGDTDPVKAKITIAGEEEDYTIDAEFDDDGVFIYAPKDSEQYPAEFPRELPDLGKAFKDAIVGVEIDHPAKYGDKAQYKVKAFMDGVSTTSAAKASEVVEQVDSEEPEADEPEGTPYELHLLASNPAAWKKMDDGNGLYLGRISPDAKAPAPKEVKWVNSKPWIVGLLAVTKSTENGKLDPGEVSDGVRAVKVPANAKVKVTDEATGELLTENRGFDADVEVFWMKGIEKVKIEVEAPAGKGSWSGVLELPKSAAEAGTPSTLILDPA